MDQAASSVSDGDLVDALIHGYVSPNNVASLVFITLNVQAGATLGSDAFARCMLCGQTSFISIRDGCYIWVSIPDLVSFVREIGWSCVSF